MINEQAAVWAGWPAELRFTFQRHLRNLSSADAAYRTLSDAITVGIVPAGQPLREEELAAVFDISRTPIREALMRLEGERLATRSRRGLVVSTISAEEIVEVYEIREALDGVAARLAARFRTDADLAELRSLQRLMSDAAVRGDAKRMARLNVEFHRVLARATRNGMLLDFVDSIHKWVLRFHSTTFEYAGRRSEALVEHGRIIEAVAAGDADTAEAVAKDHMRRARLIRIEMQARSDVEARDTDPMLNQARDAP